MKSLDRYWDLTPRERVEPWRACTSTLAQDRRSASVLLCAFWEGGRPGNKPRGTGHWWPLVYIGIFGQVFSALLNCLPFSHSVMSDSLWSHGLQHNRLRYPSLPPGVYSGLYWVGDAIQPSHPLWPPSPLARNLSQHQGLFQWVAELLVGYFVLSLPREWTGDILTDLSSTKYSTIFHKQRQPGNQTSQS